MLLVFNKLQIRSSETPQEGENANQEDIFATLNEEDDDDDDADAVHAFEIVDEGVEHIRSDVWN
jgi:hypothetical protein